MMDLNSKSNANSFVDHERYFELCALATSGSLQDKEWSQLKAHLPECVECRKLVQEYREMGRTGMALLMPEVEPETLPADQESWSVENAREELFARIARGESTVEYRPHLRVELPSRQTWIQQWFSRFSIQLALRFAAAVVLVALMIIYSFRLGARGTEALANHRAESFTADLISVRNQLNHIAEERSTLDDQVRAQSSELQRVSQQLQTQTADTERWKALQHKTAEDLQQQSAAVALLQAQYNSGVAQLNALNLKLQDSEAALQATQKKYVALSEEHSTKDLRVADLEAEVSALYSRINKANSAVEQQDRFLSADRDIRELMGARKLYIADVFDVDENGKTRKPYGRVFYTTGKSLIFYAFDLDRETHVKNPGAFQAWGRHGLGDARPLNMGIFYLDNIANKRWVLRFDNPDALAQVDAVFVTVEPPGGSSQPKGKQLLFASLHTAPNHP
jgi:predicted nuclease with TOPRIM domain